VKKERRAPLQLTLYLVTPLTTVKHKSFKMAAKVCFVRRFLRVTEPICSC